MRNLAFSPRIAATIIAACLALLFATASFAVQPDEILTDPALEARARSLSAQLRCLVCQNQSIDDSDAPLARDLRLLVRERLAAGDSDAQVKQFLVARYGEFVLLRPMLSARTMMLWTAPFMVLLVGAGIAVAAARRRTAAPAPPPLTEGEKERLARLAGD
jgi:cytochrome c-type biogenesis protein CcmH